MLLLTRKTDYALLALASLARQTPSGASARALSERLSLPLPVLRNILKQLTSRGVLKSTRGTRGGYRLARSPHQITLAQLLEAIEGPMRLARCCSVPEGEEEPECRLEESCLIRGNMRRVHASLMQFLDEVTLAQLAEQKGSEELEPGSGARTSPLVTLKDRQPYPRLAEQPDVRNPS